MKKFDEYKCMVNSYKLLTGKVSYEELLEDESTMPSFIFNPSKPVITMRDDVYDVLIEYFVEEEDYEKCSELLEHKTINSYYCIPSPLVKITKGTPKFRSL